MSRKSFSSSSTKSQVLTRADLIVRCYRSSLLETRSAWATVLIRAHLDTPTTEQHPMQQGPTCKSVCPNGFLSTGRGQVRGHSSAFLFGSSAQAILIPNG